MLSPHEIAALMVLSGAKSHRELDPADEIKSNLVYEG